MSKHKDDEVPQQEAPQEAVEEVTEAAPDTPEESPEAALKAAEDRYLRLAAEYDNFRKRSARERDAIFADVRADTVLKFLPVYDNLLRAIAAMAEDDPGRKGVEMTLAQFETVLTKLNVTPIPALVSTTRSCMWKMGTWRKISSSRSLKKASRWAIRSYDSVWSR